MTTLDMIRNSLIDKIIATQDEKLLNAIVNIFESTYIEEKVQLSSEQIELLMISENDIESGNLVSEDELRKTDIEWFN